MRLINLAYIALAAVAIPPTAQSEGDEAALTLLAQAKFAGACGVFSQMAQFQESTKMEGGDAFIDRFLSTEATRLGMSLDTFVKTCRHSVAAYDRAAQAFHK